MKVYFIGAGPGAPDLITVRGLKLIKRCSVCLYAGSLVPAEIIAQVPANALVKDTASMHLEEIIAEFKLAYLHDKDVSRIHSGDPSIYGAVAEQIRQLEQLKIDYEVVPGVPAFAAVAAKLKTELTLPEIAQTVIITRTDMKASRMPENEKLEVLGKSGATLAIHLSIRNLAYVRRTLEPFYGSDCPVVIAWRATWPDELYIHTSLAEMQQVVRELKITRTALVMVGRVFGNSEFRNSALYDKKYSHILRNRGKRVG